MERRMELESPCRIYMERRLEVWRPLDKLTPEQRRDIEDVQKFQRQGLLNRLLGRKVAKALIDVDVSLTPVDLVTDSGLNLLCSQAFQATGREAVADYIAIGQDGTAELASDTALGNESMREQGTYAKDATTGECSMDATFNITATLGLQECGLLNAGTGGWLYCRDTYSVKNVENGDTVKVYYTPKFQRPA